MKKKAATKKNETPKKVTIEGKEFYLIDAEKIMDITSKGGKARAKSLTKKRRSEIAKKAAQARWKKNK